MDNYIDIGIDFGAENIIAVAIGYDNKGRIDYKLVNLESSGAVKNYIAQRKEDNEIEIGSEIKVSYIYKDSINDYNWVCGRYKAYIAEENSPDFEVNPDKLLRYGLEAIIKKIENFDFTPLLSGKLRNLTIGVPQSWGFNKKLLYRDILNIWNHGSVTLLSEPVAATIAAYKRSSAEIGKNIIMILDIGASTFDISFAKYIENTNNLDIYKTTYRSEYAGHYFDIVFSAFALINEQNKIVTNKLINFKVKSKLKTIDDYIEYLLKNHSKFSELLLEIESIKENNLVEIIKFNRKKLIDFDFEKPITINKQIYTDALDFYVEKLSSEVNNIIDKFKNNENISNQDLIYPFLCGGASSLYLLEKKLREKINGEEKNRLFSIIKESSGNKIDTTIAIGLAYYAQNNNIINKKLEYSIGIKLPSDEEGERKNFWILNEGDTYPLLKDKKFSEILGGDKELQYHGSGDGKISFPVIQKSGIDNNKIHSDILSLSMKDCSKGDLFDLLFNVDLDGIITITISNISKNITIKKNLSLKNSLIVEGGLIVV